jgi:hypothetical protein
MCPLLCRVCISVVGMCFGITFVFVFASATADGITVIRELLAQISMTDYDSYGTDRYLAPDMYIF